MEGSQETMNFDLPKAKKEPKIYEMAAVCPYLNTNSGSKVTNRDWNKNNKNGRTNPNGYTQLVSLTPQPAPGRTLNGTLSELTKNKTLPTPCMHVQIDVGVCGIVWYIYGHSAKGEQTKNTKNGVCCLISCGMLHELHMSMQNSADKCLYTSVCVCLCVAACRKKTFL